MVKLDTVIGISEGSDSNCSVITIVLSVIMVSFDELFDHIILAVGRDITWHITVIESLSLAIILNGDMLTFGASVTNNNNNNNKFVNNYSH